MRIYTRRGDDGSTSLRGGGRVRKDSPYVEALGAVDEAQAFLGMARAEADSNSELHDILTEACRDLWSVMAQLAAHERSEQSDSGTGHDVGTHEKTAALERLIDQLVGRVDLPRDFVVPGQNRLTSLLDVSRAVVRRAERRVVSLNLEDSRSGVYLNRLADLLWVLGRWTEEQPVLAKEGHDGTA